MNIGKAFFAGVIGGAAATLIISIARASGNSADLVQMMGTLPGQAPSSATWLVGFILSMIGAGLFGILYASIFENILHRGGVIAGLTLAIAHLAISGLILGLVSALHPLIPNVLPPPGFFMAAYGGLGVLAFVLSHLAFGSIFGVLYGDVSTTKPLFRD